MSSPEDILAESLEVFYDHAPISVSSPGSTFSYRPQNGTSAITLTTPDTEKANWSLHATAIWSSAIYLADHLPDLHLDRHIERIASQGRPVKVLELGAGAGLPSILIAKSFKDVLVTCSDYPDDRLIRTLEENVHRNEVSERCRVVPYAWGSDPSVLCSAGSKDSALTGFDIVLAADTLWNSDTHRIFIETLQLTSKRSQDARIYLVAGFHTGRYVIQSFLRLMDEAGFLADELVERRIGASEERPWSVDYAEGEDERERRRWVLWMVFRWRDC